MQRMHQELLQVDELLSFPHVLQVPFRAPTLTRWGLSTQQALLDKYIRSPLLRDILSALSGNHGLAPSRVAMAIQASMVTHYDDGGFYPLGGAKRIVAEMLKAIRAHGGKIRLSTEVAEILVKRGRACGVRLKSGEVIEAENVISNADPHVTFNKLLPHGPGWRERLQSRVMEYSVGMQSLFCTVDLDLRGMGFDSGNYWWFRRGGVGAFYERAERRLPAGEVDGLFLAITTLKDPSHGAGPHVIEMFTFVPWAPFARWKDTKQGARGPAYEAFKRGLGDQMIAAAGNIIPGFSKHLTFRSDATPNTAEYYCNSPFGNSYGTAKTPWQIGPFSFPVRSSVPGLYCVGASTLSHGMAGTAMSGLMAAVKILGVRSVRSLLDPLASELRVHPADHPEQWYRPKAA
jgi:phytoene dehydrogenase-like protein